MRLKPTLLRTENDLFNYFVSNLADCIIIRLNNGNLGNGAYKAIRTFHDGKEVDKGTADCVVIYSNYSCFVEFKSAKGKQSEYQIKFEKLCINEAICYYLCYPDNIDSIISQIKQEAGDYDRT